MAIRWSRGDYIKLGRAVAEFNRQISQNETEANKQYLPKEINYRELRDSIQTREGLNSYIDSLKRIKLPGSFDLEKLEGGEIITTYQKRELERGKAQAIKSISSDIAKLEAETKSNLQIDVDIKLPQAFKSNEQKILEAKIRDYKKLYSLKGFEFKRRARELGISQTELKYRRAYIFRENYMNVMREKYSKYENYDKFRKWANQHRNPLKFYEALPDDEYYPNDLTYQSDVTFSQEDFNSFLETIGIELE